MNKVEFKAHYTDEEGEKQVHHELSTFKMIQNRWYYVTGEISGITCWIKSQRRKNEAAHEKRESV
ncbi:YchJ family metal-binding protein [Chryseobacterium indoltheticum]|uniref:YchJ family metal-binding protein n=1 Tax=Chryseobacterium indoltheticum TaxID=254 RepID=UPI003F498A58